MVAGRPYIDVRNSFNSFLPRGVSPKTGEALVDAWLDRLDANPELHDKVEFEVALTAFDFIFDDTFARRYGGVLGDIAFMDYRQSLRALTIRCLNPGQGGTLAASLAAAGHPHGQKRGEDPSTTENPTGRLACARSLLERCKSHGMLPFSIIARYAFIAEALMRSAVAKGAILAERIADFKRSVWTISREVGDDFQKVCQGRMSRQEFFRLHGHLRPGTYDILSPRLRGPGRPLRELQGHGRGHARPAFHAKHSRGKGHRPAARRAWSGRTRRRGLLQIRPHGHRRARVRQVRVHAPPL